MFCLLTLAGPLTLKKKKHLPLTFSGKLETLQSWNFHQKISTLLKCALSFNPLNCTSILTVLLSFLRNLSLKDVSFAYSLLKFLLYNGYNTRHVWEIAVRTRIEKWRSECITASSFIFTFDLFNCGQTLHKLMSGQQLYVIFWQILVKKFSLNNNKTISTTPLRPVPKNSGSKGTTLELLDSKKHLCLCVCFYLRTIAQPFIYKR